MTLNTTWGYSDHDHAWKSDETLIRNLVDIASKGGNYLLNIGPKGDGSVPAESVRSMEAIGAWMKVNGESIYGTRASLFSRLPWGRSTTKGRTLMVPGLKTRATRARLLAGGQDLRATMDGRGLVIGVPAAAPDPIASLWPSISRRSRWCAPGLRSRTSRGKRRPPGYLADPSQT